MIVYQNIMELIENSFELIFKKLKKDRINFKVLKNDNDYNYKDPFFCIEHKLNMKKYYYNFNLPLYENKFFNNFINNIVIDKKKFINGYIRFMKFSKEEADEYENRKLKEFNFFEGYLVRLYAILKKLDEIDDRFVTMRYKNKNIKYLLYISLSLCDNTGDKVITMIEHDPYIIPIKEELDDKSIHLIKIACKKLVILFKKSVGVKTR